MSDDEIERRIQKIQKLKEIGINPYPYYYDQTHFSEEIKNNYTTHEGEIVSIAGRVMSKRSFGSLVFVVIQDNEGKIQAVLTKDKLGKEFEIVEFIDVGDNNKSKRKSWKDKAWRGEHICRDSTYVSKSD